MDIKYTFKLGPIHILINYRQFSLFTNNHNDTSEIDIIDLFYLRYIQNFQRVINRYSRVIKFKKGRADIDGTN